MCNFGAWSQELFPFPLWLLKANTRRTPEKHFQRLQWFSSKWKSWLLLDCVKHMGFLRLSKLRERVNKRVLKTLYLYWWQTLTFVFVECWWTSKTGSWRFMSLFFWNPISFPPVKTTNWYSSVLYFLFREIIQNIKYSIVNFQDDELSSPFMYGSALFSKVLK